MILDQAWTFDCPATEAAGETGRCRVKLCQTFQAKQAESKSTETKIRGREHRPDADVWLTIAPFLRRARISRHGHR